MARRQVYRDPTAVEALRNVARQRGELGRRRRREVQHDVVPEIHPSYRTTSAGFLIGMPEAA